MFSVFLTCIYRSLSPSPPPPSPSPPSQLNDVMESETFNVARELLQRYDPHNPFLRATRNGRSQDTTPQRRESKKSINFNDYYLHTIRW